MNKTICSLGIVLFFLSINVVCSAKDTLYLESYLDMVLENHPLILKANLNEDIADAYLLKGKGALDPKVYSDYNQKQFDDKDYFTVWQSEAKIPTILPVDFSVGYERNDGLFLNEQNTVPDHGLIYGTLNLSLLRGLLFDSQRYDLQAAEIKGLKNQIEREIITREIVYQAIIAYLEWTAMHMNYTINQEYLTLVNARHKNVIQLFENGDSPSIDTIESRLNINSAEKWRLDSQNNLLKAKQNLSLFIWNGQQQPLEINASVEPMRFEPLIDILREMSMIINPDFKGDPFIAKFDNEIESIELDTKLEKENLKPQLDLKYNAILNLGDDQVNSSFALNDYKYGVAFLYPLLNRKSKGQLQINEALSAQSKLGKIAYLGQLNNKYQGLVASEIIQENLLLVSNEKLKNSEQLYEAERLKFNLGESSVFFLNQRERKLIEAQTDLVKNYFSIGKVLSELYYLKLGQI